MMKPNNQLVFLIFALSATVFFGCKKDSDDDSPVGPAPSEMFLGTFVSGSSIPTIEWKAETALAVHDTALGTLTISLMNSSGDQINIFLSDTTSKYYQFNGSLNTSTYISVANSDQSISTLGDDPESRKGGLLKIESYDTNTMLLQAKSPLISWVIADSATDDIPFGAITDGVFTNIPIVIE